MRYTPIAQTKARTKHLTTTLPALALAGGGVVAAGAGFLHALQASPGFAQAVGDYVPLVGQQLANTFGCSCPFCVGAAAVCKGNEAFTTDELARYQDWQQLLGHRPPAVK